MIAADVLDLAIPRTPAEAKRHWMIDRLWSIFLFSSVLILFLVGIVWLGEWPTALASRRLAMLGVVALLAQLIQIAVVLAFSLGGPVGRWRARWGNRSVAADDDETAARAAYDAGNGDDLAKPE